MPDSRLPAHLRHHIIRHNLSVFEGVGELGQNFKDAFCSISSNEERAEVETLVEANTGKIIKVLSRESSCFREHDPSKHLIAVFALNSSQAPELLAVSSGAQPERLARACLSESMKLFSVFGMRQ